MKKSGVIVEVPVSLRRANFHGSCSVGAYSYFNGPAEVFSASIGRYCSIASDVMIGPGEHPTDFLSTHPFAFGGGGNRFPKCPDYRNLLSKEDQNTPHKVTNIGHDVWIGSRAFLSQGVSIGHGAIIAAGAVVTRDVAPFSIVGGVPAQLIRMRFDDTLITRILDLQWWRYSLARTQVGELKYSNVASTLDSLEGLSAAGKLIEIKPQQKRVRRRWYQRPFTP